MVTPVPLQYLAGASCSPQALQTRQLEGSPRSGTSIPSRDPPVKVKLRLKIRNGWPRAREEVSLREPLLWLRRGAVGSRADR